MNISVAANTGSERTAVVTVIAGGYTKVIKVTQKPVMKEGEAVDMGLPSGTLWADMNIGAENPWGFGYYYAWGETTPPVSHVNGWDNYKYSNGGNSPSLTKYCNDPDYGYNGFTDGLSILKITDDAAWGDNWRLPTKAEMEELIGNTTRECVLLNNVRCFKFTSNKNGNTIYLPAAGMETTNDMEAVGEEGYYWSSTLGEKCYEASMMYLFEPNGAWMMDELRLRAMPIRPVKSSLPAGLTTVDLALPSGTKWANMNVGAQSPDEAGHYFAWGETAPQSDNAYSWQSYEYCNGSSTTMTKYCDDSEYGYQGFTDGKSILDDTNDAAIASWGVDWRMPTDNELQELIAFTNREWATKNGISGYILTSKTNGNSIFLPATGYCKDGQILMGDGFYWSKKIAKLPYRAKALGISKTYYFSSENDRHQGLAIRAVANK